MEVDPKVVVSADVRDMATVPEGSLLVLLPKPGDAEWLNVQRPLVAQRSLKVVLFCDHETTVELSERAPDFFDWISQHQEAPPGPPMHAVLGLRAAFGMDEPIVWNGPVLERLLAAFSVAFPGNELQWISSTRSYSEMLQEIRSADTAWVAYRPQTASHLREFRWAMAEAGRCSRAIVVTDTFSCPGYWPVHDRLMPFNEAYHRLRSLSSSRAGTIASLTGLEPEAVDLAHELLSHGIGEERLIHMLRDTADPGVALASEMHKVGGIPPSVMMDMAVRRAKPLLLRSLAGEQEVRRFRSEHLTSIERKLVKREPTSKDDLAAFAAVRAAPGLPRGTFLADVDAQSFIVETMLRRKARISHSLRPSVVLRILLVSLIAGIGTICLVPVMRLGSTATHFLIGLGVVILSSGPVTAMVIAIKVDNATGFIKSCDANLKEHIEQLHLAYERGAYVDAEKGLEGLLDIARAHLGVEHHLYRTSMLLYAFVLMELGNDSKTLHALDEVIAFHTRLSLDISFLIPTLAKSLTRTGRPVAAEALLRKFLRSEDSLRRIDEMPSTIMNIGGLSAETIEALVVFLAQPSAPALKLDDRVEALHLLAEALLVQGRYEEAEELLDRALKLAEELPSNDPEQWKIRTALGRTLLVQGRHREARAFLESASARAKAQVGENHADYALILEELARIEESPRTATAAP
jgi:tetratricopeptide (TPR) repeat protein